jgi:uncharacterized damage-inducible protein DinB
MSTSGTTPAVVASMGFIFNATDRLIRATLKDLPPDAFWKQPASDSNSIGWLVGHITQSRAGLLSTIAEPFDTGWGPLFKRGAEKRDAGAYPPAEELKRMGIEVTRRLRERMDTLTEKDLESPVANLQRLNVNTVAEALSFFAFHESYHVGQLGYVKKQLGYTAIAG